MEQSCNFQCNVAIGLYYTTLLQLFYEGVDTELLLLLCCIEIKFFITKPWNLKVLEFFSELIY